MSKKKEPLYVWGRGRHEDDKLAFGADPEAILHDYDLYTKFVKGIEHAVRKMIDIQSMLENTIIRI